MVKRKRIFKFEIHISFIHPMQLLSIIALLVHSLWYTLQNKVAYTTVTQCIHLYNINIRKRNLFKIEIKSTEINK